MAEQLRWILLLIGLGIILFLVWDAHRRKKRDTQENRAQDPLATRVPPPPQVSDHEQPEQPTTTNSLDDDGVSGVRELYPHTGEDGDATDVRLEPRFEASQLSAETQATAETHGKMNFEPDLEAESPVLADATERLGEQAGIDFSEPDTTDAVPNVVITINVMADPDRDFAGDALLQELLTLGLKFGEMSIFHRCEHATGQGERWFSVANAFNPGKFDLQRMGELSTLGISLFMLLPGPSEPLKAFDFMLAAAVQIVTRLGGSLEDGQHNILTKQRQQYMRGEVQEYQRRTLSSR